LEMGYEYGREGAVEARLFEGVTNGKNRGDEYEKGKIDFFDGVKGQGTPAGQVAEEDEAQADIDRVNAVYNIGRPQENTCDENAEYLFFRIGHVGGNIGDSGMAREVGFPRGAEIASG